MSLTARLIERGLRPTEALARDKPHGSRVKYMAGCRCDACRHANSSYENERQKARRRGDWNGVVSAERAKAHIRKLRREGLGRRAIASASDVREQAIQQIASGKKTRLRARLERRILAVTPAMISDRALVKAGRTWKLIGLILEEGYTKAWIAKQLGAQTPALQIGRRRVTARKAEDVARLYRRISS